MIDNIPYSEQTDKGYSNTPGNCSILTASSDIDTLRGDLPGGSLGLGTLRGPDTVWSPDTVVPVVHSEVMPWWYAEVVKDEGHAPGGPEVLSWWYETGTGHAKDTCGTVLKTVAACNNQPGKHKPLLIPDSCGRASCPVCWETWADRAGKRVLDTMEGYMALKFGNSQRPLPGLDRERLRARHITFSPDRALIEWLVSETLQETDAAGFQRLFLQKFKKVALEVVKAGGLTAGIMIIHGIRLKKDKAARKADLQNSTNRYREVLDRADWRDHVVWYPHVHVLAHGSVDSFDDFTEKTGWIYRVLRTVEEPEKVVKYLLSHAPTVSNRPAYVRFGEMNSQHMRIKKEYRCRQAIECEECKEAGIPAEKAIRVIAILADGADGKPSLKREHDDDIDARHKSRSRGAPVSWSFESVTSMRYTRVKSRCVYEWVVRGSRGAGVPRARRGSRRRGSGVVVYSELGQAAVNLDKFLDRRVWVREEVWDHLVDSGVISSWYEWGDTDAL